MYPKISCIIVDCMKIQEVTILKKKILFSLLLLAAVSAGVIYLQFGRTPEIINSRTSSSSEFTEENISVNLNKLYAGNYEQLTDEIIKRCRENDFENFLFSYDAYKPSALYCTVYLNQYSFNNGRELFRFEYTQADDNGNYNFIDNPEKFSVTIENPDN